MTEWFTKDIGLKLISLALAVGLWYYAIGEEGVEVTRNIPLRIEITNEQMSILKTSTSSVKVTLSSPRSSLSELASEEISAFHQIGAEAETAGDYSFRLEHSEIKLPSPYIRVLKVEPEVIHVTLDELIVKKLSIKADFVGEPAFGYKLATEEIQLDPNAILIEGPKAQLEGLDEIRTDPIDLVGRIRSFRRTVELDLLPNIKPLSEALIDVYVPIKEEFDEKSFENIPIKVLKSSGMTASVAINPEVVSFVLKGSRRQLEKLQPEKMLAYLDVSELGPGNHEMPVEIVLPEDVSLKESSSVVVKVQINAGK